MNLNARTATVLCLLLSLICAQAVAAKSTNKSPMQFGVIDLPPYGCVSVKGEAQCFQNQLLTRLQKELDHPIQIRVMPFPRVLDSITNEVIDYLITLENSSLTEHVNTEFKIADLKMKVYRWHDKSDIHRNRSWRLGSLRGAEYGAEVDGLDGAEVFSILNFQQGMSMFAKKRLDGIVGPTGILDTLLSFHQIPNDSVWQPIDEWAMPLYLFCRKSVCDSNTVTRLRNGLAKISAEDRQQMMQSALRANHGGSNQ